jgi:hypothetical protein
MPAAFSEAVKSEKGKVKRPEDKSVRICRFVSKLFTSSFLLFASFAAALPREWRVSRRVGRVAYSGLFEHPGGYFDSICDLVQFYVFGNPK